MHEPGSYVYILSRDGKFKEVKHKSTLNEAKFYGFNYLHKTDKPFYRFTKIPFPHLFYVSDDYIVYVVYARLKDDDIPYSVELTQYDEEISNQVFPLFEKHFGFKFIYNKEARAKYRDLPKRHIKKNKRIRKGYDNRIKHHDAYSD